TIALDDLIPGDRKLDDVHTIVAGEMIQPGCPGLLRQVRTIDHDVSTKLYGLSINTLGMLIRQINEIRECLILGEIEVTTHVLKYLVGTNTCVITIVCAMKFEFKSAFTRSRHSAQNQTPRIVVDIHFSNSSKSFALLIFLANTRRNDSSRETLPSHELKQI